MRIHDPSKISPSGSNCNCLERGCWGSEHFLPRDCERNECECCTAEVMVPVDVIIRETTAGGITVS